MMRDLVLDLDFSEDKIDSLIIEARRDRIRPGPGAAEAAIERLGDVYDESELSIMEGLSRE
jgi:hypothetical protein